MTKGTIVLAPFPFTDVSGSKVRPCVILYKQDHGEDCIVLFISSKIQTSLNVFDLKIKATPLNGLKRDSVLKIDKIATLQKKIFIGELGKLEPLVLKALDKKLKQLFALA